MPAYALGRTALMVLAVGALAAAGCATPRAQAPHAVAPLPGTDACVFVRNVSDWTVVNDSTLIVFAPMRKDAYLVKLFEPIFDLDFRQRVGFEDADHDGQLCGNSVDYLVVREESAPWRVPIVAVRKLTPDETKQLLPPPRHPAAKPPPPPPPPPAAEQH
jgi:hypothetical protein